MKGAASYDINECVCSGTWGKLDSDGKGETDVL